MVATWDPLAFKYRPLTSSFHVSPLYCATALCGLLVGTGSGSGDGGY